MRNFIRITSSNDVRRVSVHFYKNDRLNRIGDFSALYKYNNGYYEKYREKNSIFYGKKAHYENSKGNKLWYNKKGSVYKSYEEYILGEVV